jgi:hypothetical protein
MGKTWVILIAIPVFLIITFVYWKITRGYAEKEYGKKTFKQWGTRTFYWQGALLVSSGVTILIIFLLKWVNVLTF